MRMHGQTEIDSPRSTQELPQLIKATKSEKDDTEGWRNKSWRRQSLSWSREWGQARGCHQH